MNTENHEARMDAFFAESERIRVTDLYDSVQDARSEARYTCDPQAEPDTGEVKDTLARMGLGDSDTPLRGSSTVDEARPFPKSQQLARGERRYRRKIASPKQWQALAEAKKGPCRVCGDRTPAVLELHHLVSRQDHGDDLADNLVPLCRPCHEAITRRLRGFAEKLLARLTDAEYAYMVQRGGEYYPERAYGVTYAR